MSSSTDFAASGPVKDVSRLFLGGIDRDKCTFGISSVDDAVLVLQVFNHSADEALGSLGGIVDRHEFHSPTYYLEGDTGSRMVITGRAFGKRSVQAFRPESDTIALSQTQHGSIELVTFMKTTLRERDAVQKTMSFGEWRFHD
ncbi:hypothetical protein LTR17_022140 [Elasticomyces elasticus]|nr:hypothetical protein LTR17_022140 [Elasticomyces elasticus]